MAEEFGEGYITVLDRTPFDPETWPYKSVRPISEISEFQYVKNNMGETFNNDENFIDDEGDDW